MTTYKKAMTERQRQEAEKELSMEQLRARWISDLVNAVFTYAENCKERPFPNRKFKGASFTQLDNGTSSVNLIFVEERN